VSELSLRRGLALHDFLQQIQQLMEVRQSVVVATQATLDIFISSIIESEVAHFRITHPQEVFLSLSRPPCRIEKPVDPTRIIKEEIKQPEAILDSGENDGTTD
jgi:hypothetical protein